MEDLRYPIGKFEFPKEVTPGMRAQFIKEIEQAPSRLREAVKGLSVEQVHHAYRDGGWTVQQVVHHLADSHMNAYVRLKLGATENNPTIKPYDENLWANLADAKEADIQISLSLIDALHQRLIAFLRALHDTAFARTINHPELGTVRLDKYLSMYAWHGRHHVAHITALRQRMGW